MGEPQDISAGRIMDRFKAVIGSGFGSGWLPVAPGTWASLIALIPIYLCYLAGSTFGILIFAIFASALSLWTAETCTRKWGPDPARMVMDEWAGEAVVFIPFISYGSLRGDLLILLAGFVLFRIFDILKPLGISRLDRIPGKWGILLDDLLAGLYANLCLKILILLALKR